jgi:hypothetical protein
MITYVARQMLARGIEPAARRHQGAKQVGHRCPQVLSGQQIHARFVQEARQVRDQDRYAIDDRKAATTIFGLALEDTLSIPVLVPREGV